MNPHLLRGDQGDAGRALVAATYPAGAADRSDQGLFPRRLTEHPHPGGSSNVRPLRNNAAHNRRAASAAGVLPRGRGAAQCEYFALVFSSTLPLAWFVPRLRSER